MTITKNTFLDPKKKPHPKSHQIQFPIDFSTPTPCPQRSRPGHANSEAQHPCGHRRGQGQGCQSRRGQGRGTVGGAAGEVPEPPRANAAVGTRSDEGLWADATRMTSGRSLDVFEVDAHGWKMFFFL